MKDALRRIIPVALASLVLVTAACSSDSHDAMSTGSATRTVDVEMRDTAYVPDRVASRAGETVRFVFHNTGKVPHDAFVGDEAAQMDHESEMAASSGMHHGSDAITVEPGATGELTHTFSAPGPLIIGCHEPGHYAAGMRLNVEVT